MCNGLVFTAPGGGKRPAVSPTAPRLRPAAEPAELEALPPLPEAACRARPSPPKAPRLRPCVDPPVAELLPPIELPSAVSATPTLPRQAFAASIEQALRVDDVAAEMLGRLADAGLLNSGEVAPLWSATQSAANRTSVPLAAASQWRSCLQFASAFPMGHPRLGAAFHRDME